jgi:hypothetical protein
MHRIRALLRGGWKRLRRSPWPIGARTGIREPSENPGSHPVPFAPIPESIVGRLRISLGTDGGNPDTETMEGEGPTPWRVPFVHRHVWVRGREYSGMEDNDIRGFLDGRVVHSWNQASQIHVRLGRFWRGPNAGEWEIFRVLQRWDGIRLPPGARVVAATMEMALERGVDPAVGVDREMEILLYSVRKDWGPGEGGVKRNNISTAAPGEVWWNEAARGARRWGLPGAGFASDTHPDADTPAMPLAMGRYRPGDPTVSFTSHRLTRYVESHATAGKPLRFLLKLSDHLEDSSGTLLNFYSANHGDDRNTVRRPRLVVDWVPREASRHIQHDILLEHGRSLVLPRIEAPATGLDSLALSFHAEANPEADPEVPTLTVRTGRNGRISEWKPLPLPGQLQSGELDGDWVEVRLDASRDPVVIGQPFTARLRDTWVRTGPPEEQEVPWTFSSPSGREHRIPAEFEGDFTWRVSFVPDEVGRWEYTWRQCFLTEPYQSATGTFDVTTGDREDALKALGRLATSIQASGISSWKERVSVFAVPFNRVQRGLLRLQTPEEFDMEAADPGGVGAELDRTRQLISGRPPPEGSRLDPVE